MKTSISVKLIYGVNSYILKWWNKQKELEQLERMCSEITPCRPMITHTSGSYQIPSQNNARHTL